MDSIDANSICDQDIIAKIRDGDSQGMVLLYIKYKKTIYLTARTILKHYANEYAEDVSECALEKVLRGILASNYNPEKAKLVTWISAIVRHASLDALNILKEEKIHTNFNVEVNGVITPDTYGFEFIKSRCKSKRDQIIWDEIDHLPEKIADALIYIDMYNMTTAEYARMTGEIESTVRNRINRARATLREKLLLHNEFKEYA